jgi:hypothetical protein
LWLSKPFKADAENDKKAGMVDNGRFSGWKDFEIVSSKWEENVFNINAPQDGRQVSR